MNNPLDKAFIDEAQAKNLTISAYKKQILRLPRQDDIGTQSPTSGEPNIVERLLTIPAVGQVARGLGVMEVPGHQAAAIRASTMFPSSSAPPSDGRFRQE